jgi:hypothetical protein
LGELKGMRMDRIIDKTLETALLLAAVGTVFSLVRMLLAVVLPIRYYWWGAVAFVLATLVLAAAINVRTRNPRSQQQSPPQLDPA